MGDSFWVQKVRPSPVAFRDILSRKREVCIILVLDHEPFEAAKARHLRVR